MTWWRRFVRFLAREEIAAAELAKLEAERVRTDAARFAYNAGVQAEAAERLAFARGELAGQQRMADAILESVRERMGGAVDLVQEQDVIAAKKGLIH